MEQEETNRGEKKRVCPVSETTREVGHALYRVSLKERERERGWEKTKGGEGEQATGAHSPPLALKQQEEDEKREGVRERRKRRGEERRSALGARKKTCSFEIASALIHPFFNSSTSPLVLPQLWFFLRLPVIVQGGGDSDNAW